MIGDEISQLHQHARLAGLVTRRRGEGHVGREELGYLLEERSEDRGVIVPPVHRKAEFGGCGGERRVDRIGVGADEPIGIVGAGMRSGHGGPPERRWAEAVRCAWSPSIGDAGVSLRRTAEGTERFRSGQGSPSCCGRRPTSVRYRIIMQKCAYTCRMKPVNQLGSPARTASALTASARTTSARTASTGATSAP